jgi:hypothetical protein
MSRRTALLAAALVCLIALPAAAQTATPAAPAPAPATAAAAQSPAPAPTPATPDAGWLRPEPQRSVAPALPGDAQSPFAPFQASSCILQCLKSGEDGLCCSYICHPIGEDPC